MLCWSYVVLCFVEAMLCCAMLKLWCAMLCWSYVVLKLWCYSHCMPQWIKWAKFTKIVCQTFRIIVFSKSILSCWHKFSLTTELVWLLGDWCLLRGRAGYRMKMQLICKIFAFLFRNSPRTEVTGRCSRPNYPPPWTPTATAPPASASPWPTPISATTSATSTSTSGSRLCCSSSPPGPSATSSCWWPSSAPRNSRPTRTSWSWIWRWLICSWAVWSTRWRSSSCWCIDRRSTTCRTVSAGTTASSPWPSRSPATWRPWPLASIVSSPLSTRESTTRYRSCRCCCWWSWCRGLCRRPSRRWA